MHGDRKKKTPESVTIKAATNGGFITTHHYNNSGSGESYMPSQDHAFGDYDTAEKHTRQALTGKGGDPAKRDGFGGGTKGAGGTPSTTKAPAASHQDGTGTAKAAPPSRRTHGAGID